MDQLNYNPLATSTGSCSGQYSQYCLCIAAPDCTQTNGATANSGACLCGAGSCTVTSGLFCYAFGSTCATSAILVCSIQDGSAANDAACACGSEACTSATGLFCYASSNHCRHNIPPPVPDTSLQQNTPVPDRSSGFFKIVDDWIDTWKRSGIESTYGPIAEWDTSGVTTMESLFIQKENFNADISKWNVSQVLYMNNSTSF